MSVYVDAPVRGMFEFELRQTSTLTRAQPRLPPSNPPSSRAHQKPTRVPGVYRRPYSNSDRDVRREQQAEGGGGVGAQRALALSQGVILHTKLGAVRARGRGSGRPHEGDFWAQSSWSRWQQHGESSGEERWMGAEAARLAGWRGIGAVLTVDERGGACVAWQQLSEQVALAC